LVFYGFDLLFDGADDLRALAFAERKRRLETLLSARKAGEGARVRFVEHFETGGDAVLRSACKLSREGIASKRADARYHPGRTDSWRKAKCRAGHEVVIGGWSTTDGDFRSLLVGVHRGEHFAYIGRVGSLSTFGAVSRGQSHQTANVRSTFSRKAARFSRVE
jgi:bifunctional non-homologous end joining protein LigD